MGQHALVPCIICDKVLENVESEAENQPYAGTSFSTTGHYGSTAFDPLNGSMIEINICDKCLKEKGKAGKVLWRREAKALIGAPPWRNAIFGWLENLDAPYVAWNPDLDENDGMGSNEQRELERIPVESKEELEELIERYGVRLLGGVKLNGRFTPETLFAEEFLDEETES